MGKICDPPLFTGGQCSNISYRIRGRSRQIFKDTIYLYFEFRSFIDSDFDYSYTGPILNVYIELATGRFNIPEPTGYWIWIQTNEGLYRRDVGVYNPIITDAYFLSLEVVRLDGQPDNCGNPLGTNCRCSDDSCRVDCESSPDGFCCIDHSLTDRLLQVLES